MSTPRRGRRPRSEPEDSIRLRLVVAAIVMVAVGAVVAQGAVDAFTAAAALVLPPIGFAFSHAQRHKANRAAKVVLAVALLAAFGAFLQHVRFAGSLDQARTSLASLFLWVQVLHAFDVPRRRDLAFSVVSSTILIAEAGSLSLDTRFLLFLVPWALLAGAWLYLTSRPRPGLLGPAVVSRRASSARRTPLAAARSLALAGVAAVLASGLVFMATPRLPGVIVVTPPFSLSSAVPVGNFQGQVENPGLPASSGGTGADPAEFTATSYPGFGGRVDLRSRGRLSGAIVMKVRSPEAALWRGEAFDVFDGLGWEASDKTTQVAFQQGDRGYESPEGEEGSVLPTHRLVQTFYIESREPNVVFGAYRATEVYFPASGLRVDRYGSIRSPILLEDGMIYSVVSDVPVRSNSLLRLVRPAWPDRVLQRYTQLPDSFSDRVVRLANRITEGATTTYDKVTAVQAWLREHTEYNLGIPPDQPGADPIETFLFQRREGFCEHIASSMALLLRAVGVPTRLVTGFGPGERNALTGYFEVRERDAHAWVEVLYPDAGWVTYDPTFGVPRAESGYGGRLIAPEVIRAIGRWLAGIVPEPVRRVAKVVGSAISAMASAALHWWPVAIGLVIAVALALAWRRRGRRRPTRGPSPTGAAAAFAELTDALRPHGIVLGDHETPSELLRLIESSQRVPGDSRDDAVLVVRTFERERFSPRRPGEDEIAACVAAVARVRSRSRERANASAN